MVLHAAAGCAAGAVASGNCSAGAIAEGLQELAGKPIEELAGDSQRATAVVGLVAAIGAALSGASADAISEAANIAETAHRFNYLAHEEKLAELRAEKQLKACKADPATCTLHQVNGLQQTITRLQTLDKLRDAQLLLTCSAGNRLECASLLRASWDALQSYPGAARRYRSKEAYLTSLGVDPNDMAASAAAIDKLRRQVDGIIGNRDAREVQAQLDALGLGAAGGAIAAGGMIIATDAIPAALDCLKSAYCANQMAIALGEAAAGDALGGASLAPAITTAGGTLVLRKGDEILGVIDEATGKLVNLGDDAAEAAGTGRLGRVSGEGAGAADAANRTLGELFSGNRTPKASELSAWAEKQGWTPSRTLNGPLKYTDFKGYRTADY